MVVILDTIVAGAEVWDPGPVAHADGGECSRHHDLQGARALLHVFTEEGLAEFAVLEVGHDADQHLLVHHGVEAGDEAGGALVAPELAGCSLHQADILHHT